jgi:hypothetical protein
MRAAFAALCTSPVFNSSADTARDIGDAQRRLAAAMAGREFLRHHRTFSTLTTTALPTIDV